MYYWLPEPLPLPPYTKTLYWTNGVLDTGVAWYLTCRGKFNRGQSLPPVIPEKEFNALLHVRTDILYRYKTEALKTHEVGEIMLVDVGKVKRNTYAFDEEEHRHKCYLVFLKVEGGYILYPRSLRSSSWDAKLTRLITQDRLEKLAPTWRAMIKALPKYATTPFEKHSGLPYRFGTINDLSYEREIKEGWWTEHNHPFWQHAKIALLAGAAMESVAFPGTNDRVLPTFHWSVFSRNPINAHEVDPTPLRVELTFDGWKLHPREQDIVASPTPQQALSLKRVKATLEDLLSAHIPDVPYFMDNCSPRGELMQAASHYEIYNQPQFHPWIREVDKVIRTRSAHDALYWLNQLPQDWGRDLIALLEQKRNHFPA